MLNNLKLAIVDVETTGADVTGDRVIEIGVHRVEGGAIVRSLDRLVNPEQVVSPFIEQLTGIRNRDLEGQPTFGEIRHEVEEILEGCVFVAHNVGFDYGLLRSEFIRLGRPFTAQCLCSVRLSRRLYPRHRRHGLSELIKRFDIPCERRHRALADADAVWAFLQRSYEDRGPARFGAAVTALLRTPKLPPQLSEEALKGLPDGPGVYVFSNAAGRALYVGKSRDVRSRVIGHFSGDHPSARARRLYEETARIDAQRTEGEAASRDLEARLIQELSPRYNRRRSPVEV